MAFECRDENDHRQESPIMPRPPAHEIRFGLIKASIGRKRTHHGPRHQVTVVRLFRDGDIWKQSARFGRNDIPQVRLALDAAYEWILQHSSNEEAGQDR